MFLEFGEVNGSASSLLDESDGSEGDCEIGCRLARSGDEKSGIPGEAGIRNAGGSMFGDYGDQDALSYEDQRTDILNCALVV